MIRKYLHIIICLAATLLVGCRSEYPHVEYEGNPGTVEFENINSRVPIMVAISDPLYATYTRGMGAFDNVRGENPINKGKDADFFVYAFYSPGVAGTPGGFNYSERMNSKDEEKIYCLVDDTDNDNLGHGKRARLNLDKTSFLQWVDEDEVYYSSSYPQYRYKFFAYHLDDAADLTRMPERKFDHIAYDVTIDGTQDLMGGYASPTKEQLNKLAAVSNKHILNNLDKLAYSTETGNFNIFPIFDMKHQLAYLTFSLKADSIVVWDEEKNEMVKVIDPEVKNVRLGNIFVTSPYHGEFVVAADDVNRLGVNFTSETKELYLPVKVKTGADGNIMTDEEGNRITVSREEEGVVMAGDEFGLNPRMIPDAIAQEVGAGILLPSSEEYSLNVEYVHIVKDPITGVEKSISYVSMHSLKLDGGFQAGSKYEVVIKVYGLHKLVLQLGDIRWLNGGEIEVDSDAAKE